MFCIVIDAHLSDGDQLAMHGVFLLREIEVSTRVHLFPPTPSHFPSHALLFLSPYSCRESTQSIEQAVTLLILVRVCVCVVVCVCVCMCGSVCVHVW